MNRYRLVRENIKFLLIMSALFLVPLVGFAQDNTQPFVIVRPLHTLDHRLGVSSLSWSPNGNLLVTKGMNSSDITVWDVRSGRPVQVLQRKLAFGESLDFSPDGRFLITSAAEDHLGAALTVWDAETWKIVRHVSGIFSDKPPAYSAARRFSLSAVSGKIAYFSSLSPQSSITILDISTWEQLAVLTGVKNSPSALAFSPDGRSLAAGNSRGVIDVVDVVTNDIVRSLHAYQGYSVGLASLAYSPDGRSLASGHNGLLGARQVEGGRFESRDAPPEVVRVWRMSDGEMSQG